MTGFWSSETLRRRIPSGRLVDPYDPAQIQNCSYELRLGAEVYVTSEDSKTKRLLDDGEQIRIPSGQFANLLTEETIRVPADALGLISAKFRWKQRGLVNVSGFHVDPGYTGKILFSVYNAGPTPVVVARGDRLFLLWFCNLDTTTKDTYNKAPRTAISSDDVAHLQGDVATPQALAARVQRLEGIVGAAKWILLAVLATLIGIGVKALVSDGGGTDSPSTPTVPVSTTALGITSVPSATTVAITAHTPSTTTAAP